MIKVLKPGFFTTVQDAGRYGYTHYGVPVAGAMDLIAYKNGNSLLGNQPNAASLEITMTGPALLFAVDTMIVITGAWMSPKVNDIIVSNNEILFINKGDILSFGKLLKGFRTYLAVAGGFQTEEIMGSRSFMEHITPKVMLKENDTLLIDELPDGITEQKKSIKTEDDYLDEEELKVLRGPEYDLLSDAQKKQIREMEFSVSKDNNRMAYQLSDKLDSHDHSMITSAALPGTVQLTPEGKLIILMRNGQTTGGYIRILQLTEKAISILAQKKNNDKLKLML